MNSIAFDVENEKRFSSRIQNFFRRYQISKLLEGFITRKEEICARVVDFLAGLPDDMKRFLDFKGLMGTPATKMGCEV